jgi:hypothetical protein
MRVLALLGLLFSVVAEATEPREIQYGHTTIRWTDSQLSLVQDTKESVFFDSMDEKSYDERTKRTLQEHRSGMVLSVVGPWVSLSKEWYSDSGAHPSYGTQWRAMDVTRGGRTVSLRDLFTDKILLEALLKNPVLIGAQIEPVTGPLMDFLGSMDGDCGMTLNSTLLNTWAFYELKESTVVVQIGIRYGYEVCRGAFTKINVELPIPPHLAGPLKEADARKTLLIHFQPTPESP